MTIIEVGLSIFGLIMTGVCTMLWQKINKIEDNAEKANTDLAKFKLEVAKDVDQANKDLGEFKLYVSKEHPTQENFIKAVDGFNSALRDVFGAVNGIKDDIKTMSDVFRDKLDQKADRNH